MTNPHIEPLSRPLWLISPLSALIPHPKASSLLCRCARGHAGNRYQNPDLSTRVIRDVLERLSEFQAVELNLGKKWNTTTVFPTQWFMNRVREKEVTLGDFGWRENEEVIILKRKDKAEDEGWTFEAGASYEDYEDTEETLGLRAEVRAFNRFLETSDVNFIADGLDPTVNTNDRRLRRYFTAFRDAGQTFDRAGQLFGGWWLHLAKERRGNIRVQGEPVADLDYASMFGRLAYAHLGLIPPEADLYDLTGLLRGYDAQGGATQERRQEGLQCDDVRGRYGSATAFRRKRGASEGRHCRRGPPSNSRAQP